MNLIFTRAIPADKLDVAAAHGMKWLAAEHNFFAELQRDLETLRKNLTTARASSNVADIKRAFRDFKFIGKCERRADNYENQVMASLETYAGTVRVQGTLDEITQLRERIHVEAAELVRVASFYEGEIKSQLVHLRDNIQEQHFDQAQALIMEIEQRIEEAEKWLAALVKDLTLAKTLHRTAAEGFGYVNQAMALEEEAKNSQDRYNYKKYIEAGNLFATGSRWSDAGRCFEAALETEPVGVKELFSTYIQSVRVFEAFAVRRNWKLAVEYGLVGAFMGTYYPQHRILKMISLVKVLTQNGLEKKKAWSMFGDKVLESKPLSAQNNYEIALYCYTQAGDSVRAGMCRTWFKSHAVGGQAGGR
ncbi:TPA: hypothetical protein HA241_03895 [Candidatus Woesearchaeota archaeon]|nr:hypothetical protein [Candidatus Woesearchaeota archaeon]